MFDFYFNVTDISNFSLSNSENQLIKMRLEKKKKKKPSFNISKHHYFFVTKSK